MYCKRCKNKISIHDKVCPKCGYTNHYIYDFYKSLILTCILMISVFIISYHFTNYFYHATTSNIEDTQSSTKKLSKYETIIKTERTYKGVRISSSKDAIKIIKEDSTSQKSTCSSDITKLENHLIKKYGVTAINLCEMDYSFAYELENVIKYIYNTYPKSRGYLTNITLKNMDVHDSRTIASFLPTFQFATSSSMSTYPWVYKMQIFLNSSYFLNEKKLENVVKTSGETGHFPKNTTRYSPVAHEMGHYLSFVALMKKYKLNSTIYVTSSNQDKLVKVVQDFNEGYYSKEMLKEAYNYYVTDTEVPLSFDEWRSTISGYAMSKDGYDNYIYDETIAEAFHDVYLNRKNAQPASKYIVNVLNKKLER